MVAVSEWMKAVRQHLCRPVATICTKKGTLSAPNASRLRNQSYAHALIGAQHAF